MTASIPRVYRLPEPPATLRDRVRFTTADGRDCMGWITGACCPQGRHMLDVLEDHQPPPGESRTVHQNVPAERVLEVVERGAFCRAASKRSDAA